MAQDPFFWGVLGSISAEVVLLYGYYLGGRDLPRRYRRAGFWLVRLALALVAGGLVVAYGVESRLLAIHLGATTPLVIQSFANNARRFL